MDEIAAYLEKLGYAVEDQGQIKHFLLVLKDSLPVGFILPDYSVRMIEDVDDTAAGVLPKVINFVKANQGLPMAGKSEYIVATYRGNQLTTFFDVNSGLVKYAVYTINQDSGELTIDGQPYESYDNAALAFVTVTGMIRMDELEPPKVPLNHRWRRKLARRLLNGI